MLKANGASKERVTKDQRPAAPGGLYRSKFRAVRSQHDGDYAAETRYRNRAPITRARIPE